MKDKKCKVCNVESNTTICSDACKKAFTNLKAKERTAKQNANIEGVEGKDFIICKWCNCKVKRVYGVHILKNHTDKTIDDYKLEFPNSPITTTTDKELTSKNSGLHMKEDKYREWAKERLMGDKNHNHKTKTTELQRQQKSPFSKEFYMLKGLNESESIEAVSVFTKSALKDRITQTQFEWWLNFCNGDVDAAKILYTDRQTTFSLEKCIKKHGEENGFKIWQNRQNDWINKVYNDTTCIGGGTSKLGNELFVNIKTQLPETFHSELQTHPNEKFIRDNGIAYKYDFCLNNYKKIIEFNGTFWHCKNTIYKSDYLHPVKKMTAQEIWEHDRRKSAVAIKHNYKVFVVWEDDYVNNPELVIKECLEFINS